MRRKMYIGAVIYRIIGLELCVNDLVPEDNRLSNPTISRGLEFIAKEG